MHLLGQSPTASFWQAIGPICNVQMHGKGFSHSSQDKPFGKGACAAGAAQPPRDGAGLLALLGLGEQSWRQAVDLWMQKSQLSWVPCRVSWVHTTMHRQLSYSSIAPKPAVSGLLLSVLVAARTCVACASTTSPAGSKHGWHARALAVP